MSPPDSSRRNFIFVKNKDGSVSKLHYIVSKPIEQSQAVKPFQQIGEQIEVGKNKSNSHGVVTKLRFGVPPQKNILVATPAKSLSVQANKPMVKKAKTSILVTKPRLTKPTETSSVQADKPFQQIVVQIDTKKINDHYNKKNILALKELQAKYEAERKKTEVLANESNPDVELEEGLASLKDVERVNLPEKELHTDSIDIKEDTLLFHDHSSYTIGSSAKTPPDVDVSKKLENKKSNISKEKKMLNCDKCSYTCFEPVWLEYHIEKHKKQENQLAKEIFEINKEIHKEVSFFFFNLDKEPRYLSHFYYICQSLNF